MKLAHQHLYFETHQFIVTKAVFKLQLASYVACYIKVTFSDATLSSCRPLLHSLQSDRSPCPALTQWKKKLIKDDKIMRLSSCINISVFLSHLGLILCRRSLICSSIFLVFRIRQSFPRWYLLSCPCCGWYRAVHIAAAASGTGAEGNVYHRADI